ncbi:MBL fold metallo-hydrolase [Marinicella litoralis]|uniref:Glyoxylase-like metal-dependent hydrolase (Beta-lactamase superfamily II) n=1 Tax=Marinicella litoralis TaxID=644220 RepID=A0A4R6XDV9_9GAMM|nr:MBL fold metallo-hydrolase [Marinicella litoralis]TDR16349.1 glyoxylase-like metal-dependent hydrolase (beta-lactamase superfamily II) [Marinicella litoralis]
MHIQHFYDPDTSTFSYIVVDQSTNQSAVIDSVLNYDQDAAKASTESADQIITYINENQLKNQWILETHIHADHVSAAHYLQAHIGGKTAIGAGIKNVLRMWVPIFDTGDDTPIDGSQYDHLFDDEECFEIGTLTAKVMHTPGHTPACASYHINQAVFVGDTLFAPHLGTARVDFPGGSAEHMFNSIQKLYQLPNETQVFLCHDYPDEGEEPMHKTTIGEQKTHNKMIKTNTTLAEYKEKRETRDQQLSVPKLILPSIQSNMRLGDFGEPADNGIVYIKIPMNQI